LIDVVGGQRDLQERLVRRVTPMSLADDPVRLLRAVRFANQFNFAIETETRAQLGRLVSTIDFVSPERVRDELWKLMLAPRPDRAIEWLQEVGLLAQVLPEVAAMIGVEQSYPHLYAVFEHTLNALHDAAALRDWIMGETSDPPNARHAFVQHKLAPWQHRLRHHLGAVVSGGRRRADWFVWNTLLHDIGKSRTRTLVTEADGITRTRFYEHEPVGAALAETRLTHLRFSRQEIELACASVLAHMRPHHLHMSFVGQRISNRAMYRFFRDVGGKHSGIGPGLDAILVALADRLSVAQDIPPDDTGYINHLEELLHYAFEAAAHLPLPLVDGHLLMQRLAVPPGPQLGALLEHLMEAQAAGEIKSADEALQLASSWLNAMQPTEDGGVKA
jgi:tRNA nucleotidyltransferase/poly(A) polymerase